jgi:hypothetical protein
MRNNGSTLVPVTHRIFDPPSTRRAPARGTSARRRPGGRVAARRGRRFRPVGGSDHHHHRSSRILARYPQDGRFRLARRGTGRDGPPRIFVSASSENPVPVAHARPRVRIPRRNEPPPLYIPAHRTARGFRAFSRDAN